MRHHRRTNPAADQPCPGRSCHFTRTCPHHDDCFLRRRAMGRPDMLWDEAAIGRAEPPMSEWVRSQLEGAEG